MSPTVTLNDRIQVELRAIPIAEWSCFFPAHVAVAKEVHEIDPSLGPLVARNPPPSFDGPGATRLVDKLMSDDSYLDLVESLMTSAADQLDLASFEGRSATRLVDKLMSDDSYLDLVSRAS